MGIVRTDCREGARRFLRIRGVQLWYRRACRWLGACKVKATESYAGEAACCEDWLDEEGPGWLGGMMRERILIYFGAL